MLKRIRSKKEATTLHRLLSVTAAAALLVGVVGVAQASAPTAATGTGAQSAISSLEVRMAGPNTILEQTSAGMLNGTLTGTTEDSFTAVIHPNGNFNAHGTVTCECTVDGKSGVLEFVSTNTGEVIDGVPTFAGRFVIKGGTGELSGLQGVLEFEGTVDLATGLNTITYSGQIHSHP